MPALRNAPFRFEAPRPRRSSRCDTLDIKISHKIPIAALLREGGQGEEGEARRKEKEKLVAANFDPL